MPAGSTVVRSATACLSAGPGTAPGTRFGVQLLLGQAGPDVLERGQQLHRVARPAVGVAGRGRQHYGVQLRGQARQQGGRRRDVVAHRLVEDLHRRLALVRLAAGQHLEHHHAAGVDVGARIRGALLDLLRGQVGDGAHDLTRGHRAVPAHGPDQPEVGDLDPAVLAEQHVLRLHVAVHQSRAVRGAEGGQDRLQHVQHHPRAQRAPVPQQVAQGPAGHVLHGQEDHPVVRALVVDIDHIGVRQPGDGLGLADEAVGEVGVRGQPGVHRLEGDDPVEPGVHGAVDRGHAADGDALLDPVAAVEHPPEERVVQGRVHPTEFRGPEGGRTLRGDTIVAQR